MARAAPVGDASEDAGNGVLLDQVDGMSTKALNAALWDMENHGSGDQPRLAKAARVELEAIERAAKAWSSRGTVVPPDKMANFWALLESIAKDAP